MEPSYVATALVPVANALRGVAAGFVTADIPTLGGWSPNFYVHGNPVHAPSEDGRVLQALHELGIIELGPARPAVPRQVVRLALNTRTPTTRTINTADFSRAAQMESFARFATQDDTVRSLRRRDALDLGPIASTDSASDGCAPDAGSCGGE